jgi:hypothetical protein
VDIRGGGCAESKAVDGVLAVLGVPRVEGRLTAQILSSRSAMVALAYPTPAYLTEATTTHQAMRNGPEAFQTLHRPSSEELRPQSLSLHGGAGALWPPEFQEVSPNSLDTIAAAQRDFSRQSAQALHLRPARLL